MRGEKLSLRSKMFDLARRLKDVAREIDAPTLDAIGNEWHRLAGAAVVSIVPAEVRVKLKNAFEKCRYGFNDATLASEFAKRKAKPLSEVARQFDRDPMLQQVVIACETAAGMNGGGDFPMSQRRLGDLIGVSQQRAGDYLATLIEAGAIAQTRGYVKGKWPKAYRLIERVKTLAEKIRDTLASLVKFVAGAVGKLTTTSEPSEPQEPADASDHGDEPSDWINGPIQSRYKPPAVEVVNGRATLADIGVRERDRPQWKRKRRRESIELAEVFHLENCGIDTKGYAIKKHPVPSA